MVSFSFAIIYSLTKDIEKDKMLVESLHNKKGASQ